MSDDDTTIPHLRRMHAVIVDSLCAKARSHFLDSYGVLTEVDGFRESRTPWDARRLANAMANYDPSRVTPEVAAIIAELDKLALQKAGLQPGPRPQVQS